MQTRGTDHTCSQTGDLQKACGGLLRAQWRICPSHPRALVQHEEAAAAVGLTAVERRRRTGAPKVPLLHGWRTGYGSLYLRQNAYFGPLSGGHPDGVT